VTTLNDEEPFGLWTTFVVLTGGEVGVLATAHGPREDMV
jgi:hypothetical protein